MDKQHNKRRLRYMKRLYSGTTPSHDSQIQRCKITDGECRKGCDCYCEVYFYGVNNVVGNNE